MTSHIKHNGKPATMADVAALAGVSSQTVSRVSNGGMAVTASTHKKVLEAMAALDYRPNSAARALKRGHFRSIGIILFSLQTIGSVRMLDAIAFQAARRRTSIDLISIGDPTTGEIIKALSRLDEEAVDGIIVILEARLLRERAITFPTRIPTIIIDPDTYDNRVSVNANQRQGAELAVRHLLELGHPTVWHIQGPVDTSNSAAQRAEAWRKTLEGEHRRIPTCLGGTWQAETGYEAGLMLADRDDVSAIFCANDQLALGCMRALHEKGRSIPRDVSIVGFDDIPEAAQFWPPLTTVHQNFAGVGTEAVSLLTQLIDGKPLKPGLRYVPNTLVTRESTSPFTS